MRTEIRQEKTAMIRKTSKASQLLLALSVSLGGCGTASLVIDEARYLADNSGLKTRITIDRSSQFALARASSFYLARNPTLDQLHSQYGFAATEALESALHSSFSQIETGLIPEDLESARRSADRLGIDYLLFPRIIHWDDDIGSWSELGASLLNENSAEIRERLGFDEAQLQIMVVHASTGAAVDKATITATSGLLTLYGDEPAKLIHGALIEFFQQLGS
jgi:hypothetical protein